MTADRNRLIYPPTSNSTSYEFTFTPSVSLFLECQASPSWTARSPNAPPNGAVLMPAGNYGFCTKFT
jgi:hypothetical protein